MNDIIDQELFGNTHFPKTDPHCKSSSEKAWEGPPSAATALADSLGENAR